MTQKLSAEIMSGNYYRKLSASIYHHSKNVGIIGILAYPKINVFILLMKVKQHFIIGS